MVRGWVCVGAGYKSDEDFIDAWNVLVERDHLRLVEDIFQAVVVAHPIQVEFQEMVARIGHLVADDFDVRDTRSIISRHGQFKQVGFKAVFNIPYSAIQYFFRKVDQGHCIA